MRMVRCAPDRDAAGVGAAQGVVRHGGHPGAIGRPPWGMKCYIILVFSDEAIRNGRIPDSPFRTATGAARGGVARRRLGCDIGL